MKYGGMKYNEGQFDYDRRTGDKLGNGLMVAWDYSIISIDGAHYHAWFPKCKGAELKKWKADFKYHASYQGDPVKLSYAWIPQEEEVDA